jgi:hypothetical protein
MAELRTAIGETRAFGGHSLTCPRMTLAVGLPPTCRIPTGGWRLWRQAAGAVDEMMVGCPWTFARLIATNFLWSSPGSRTQRPNGGSEAPIGHSGLSSSQMRLSVSSGAPGKRGATNSWRGTGTLRLATWTVAPSTDGQPGKVVPEDEAWWVSSTSRVVPLPM